MIRLGVSLKTKKSLDMLWLGCLSLMLFSFSLLLIIRHMPKEFKGF